MNKRRTFRLPLLLSLAVHGVLAVILFVSPGLDPARFKKQHLNQVELIDADKLLAKIQQHPDLLKGQIVEQDQNPLNDETPEDAKYLSQHNQKVVKETQAANKGKFKNTDESAGVRVPEPQNGKPTEKTSEKPTEKIVDKTEKDQPEKADKKQAVKPDDLKDFMSADDGIGLKTKPSIKDLTPSFKLGPPPVEDQNVAKGGGDGPSASDDHLKNVPTGMQTLLSTREFVYYSYYNRIKEKLRQYWEPKIKEKMERILRQGRTIASSTDRVTRVIIVLDQRGTLVRVQIVGASGVTDLDEAAVEAFRAAAPFPNPPKGIVESDGTIKIRWDFILEA